MLHTEAGRNLKLGRLTPAERCAWTYGVLAIAAKAQARGAFMVGDMPAVAEDVALQANVPKPVAAATLRKLRAMGMLEQDDELGAEWVHDFEEHNPEPKKDGTAKERAKRYRDRQKAKRNGAPAPPVTAPSHRDERCANGTVTPPEGEGEEKNTPLPPEGELPELPVKPTGTRKTGIARFDEEVRVYAAARFPDLDEPEGSQLVRAAIGRDLGSHAAVARYVRRWAPAPADVVVPIHPEEDAA
jgi:hypothetical protein